MAQTKTHLTCLECGNTAITTKEQDSIGPYNYRKIIQCDHCGEEGRLFGESGPMDDEIKSGNFSHLTDDGLDTLRENMDDFEFVSYED